ncbi:MAG: hypothetical protein JJT99_13780 [Rhodobacteraceae bacterium]|nr:hypothetical protein [Paracoccaceae bacterium]
MSETADKPVVSEDVTAAFLAALKRAESVPTCLNMIDTMSDDEWAAEDASLWNITAGSEAHIDEADDLDAETTDAA